MEWDGLSMGTDQERQNCLVERKKKIVRGHATERVTSPLLYQIKTRTRSCIVHNGAQFNSLNETFILLHLLLDVLEM